MQSIAWLLSGVTALWFGVLAHRSRRNWFPWAVGGGLFALVTATIVFGVSQAVFIPLSHEAYAFFRITVIACAALMIALLGWIITADMHHQPAILWKWIKTRFDTARERNHPPDASAK